MNKEKNYITDAGYKKLLDEYDWLLKKERPKITDIVSWAASLGDRSENADYQYGKKRLREIDRRMRFLNKRIDCAIKVNPLESNSNKIQFGATVIVEDVEEKVQKTYSIVGADEIDMEKGYISWKSPIAKALLTKEVGDIVVVSTPKGEYELEIVKLEYKKIEIEEFNEN